MDLNQFTYAEGSSNSQYTVISTHLIVGFLWNYNIQYTHHKVVHQDSRKVKHAKTAENEDRHKGASSNEEMACLPILNCV